MAWLITNIVAALLLPPLSLIVLLALGMALLTGRHAVAGKRLVWLAIVMLYLLGTPFLGRGLLATLEPAPPLHDLGDAQAIVVLGGGVYHDAPEYAGDNVKSATLERLRYAARLQRLTGLPLLASGGSPEGGEAESLAMRKALRTDFGLDARWIETASTNTVKNALYTRKILAPLGINRILLVTHAWHMRRARAAFENAGFNVIPAPTIFAKDHALSALDFLPSAQGLLKSRTALHEWLGILWYRLRTRG